MDCLAQANAAAMEFTVNQRIPTIHMDNLAAPDFGVLKANWDVTVHVPRVGRTAVVIRNWKGEVFSFLNFDSAM